VAADGGFNTSPVLLASFAVALARRTGRNPVMTLVTVSNRFRPGLAESVSPVSQVTPLMIDVADITVGEAVTRSAQSALAAYKNAYCDPYEQDEVVERVGVERGEEIDLSCYYNDRRQLDRGPTGETPTAEQIRAAVPAGTAHWEHELEMSKAKVYLYVDEAPGAIEFLLSVDTRYFSAEETEALAREMETVAVEAALDPTAATGVHSVPAPV
jgi:non-ribosomal peptide synthetase component F